MKVKITLERDAAVGDVDNRLFGGFAEHLGRCIYEGIYEPGHPSADEQGFRKDVLDLIRELNMPVMRYPGGNFVSGYNWEDGVGPKEKRPRRLDLAWTSTETNEFGTNEFADWCRKANTIPMLAVNLGTRGLDAARNMVEYCNHPSGTYWSDLRREHGWDRPHDIKLWCLGNEMDGPWQMGHETATEYGRVACEAAKLMKMVDPSIELVVCGSSGRGMPTFGKWEKEVLDHTFDHVDYVSIHTYYGNRENDTPRFLARPDEMGTFIEDVVTICDEAAAKKKSSKKIMLSFDEWNVWFHSHGDRDKIERWSVAPPLLEDAYTMEDTLVVGGMLITLLNHCDRVKIGCIAQIVNVIAPIMTRKDGPAWRQTIFYPFAQASNLGRGTVLRAETRCATYKCEGHHAAPYLTSASVYDTQGTLTVFAVNRSLDDDMDLTIELRGFGELRFAQSHILRHDDLKAVNTCENPDTVTPEGGGEAVLEDGAWHTLLPPASWNVIRLSAT